MFKHRPLPDYNTYQNLKKEMAPPRHTDPRDQEFAENIYWENQKHVAAMQREIDSFEMQLDHDLKVGYKVIAQYSSDAPGGITLLLHKSQ